MLPGTNYCIRNSFTCRTCIHCGNIVVSSQTCVFVKSLNMLNVLFCHVCFLEAALIQDFCLFRWERYVGRNGVKVKALCGSVNYGHLKAIMQNKNGKTWMSSLCFNLNIGFCICFSFCCLLYKLVSAVKTIVFLVYCLTERLCMYVFSSVLLNWRRDQDNMSAYSQAKKQRIEILNFEQVVHSCHTLLSFSLTNWTWHQKDPHIDEGDVTESEQKLQKQTSI